MIAAGLRVATRGARLRRACDRHWIDGGDPLRPAPPRLRSPLDRWWRPAAPGSAALAIATGSMVATRCARLHRACDRHYPETVLDLRGDPIALTAALVDIPSESRDEARLADEVEAALRAQTSGFEIIRNGNAVLARTNHRRPSRVLLAGHLDTVPV